MSIFTLQVVSHCARHSFPSRGQALQTLVINPWLHLSQAADTQDARSTPGMTDRHHAVTADARGFLLHEKKVAPRAPLLVPVRPHLETPQAARCPGAGAGPPAAAGCTTPVRCACHLLATGGRRWTAPAPGCGRRARCSASCHKIPEKRCQNRHDQNRSWAVGLRHATTTASTLGYPQTSGEGGWRLTYSLQETTTWTALQSGCHTHMAGQAVDYQYETRD